VKLAFRRFDAFSAADEPAGAFDRVYFEALSDNAQLIIKKRSTAAEDLQSTLGGATGSNGEAWVSAQPKSLDAPGSTSMIFRVGAGSANAFGQGGGDHPINLFPETHIAPITVNPEDSSLDGVQAGEYSGDAGACLEGSLGCSCRNTQSAVRCDAPFTCNTAGFCTRPACPAGNAGCACGANQACPSGFGCNSDSVCVFQPSCTQGSVGCQCKPGLACNDAQTICSSCEPEVDDATLARYAALTQAQLSSGPGEALKLVGVMDANAVCNGVCLKKTPCDSVNFGQSGCPCKSDGSCLVGTDLCDTASNICQAPRCSPGSPGCNCADGGRCSANFDCVEDRCVVKTCPSGVQGCPCDKSKGTSACTSPAFSCLSVDSAGTDFRCVAQSVVCGDNLTRCKLFCGDNNVLSCPSCANQKILCRSRSSSAQTTTVSVVVLAMVFLLALLF